MGRLMYNENPMKKNHIHPSSIHGGVLINVGSLWSPKLAFTYETLARSIKKAPNQGINEEQKEMTEVSTKSPKWVTKGEGNKLCSKSPISCEKYIPWEGKET